MLDDAQIASLLERDRDWCAYGLCDLAHAYRPYARYIGALRGGTVTAIVLLYTPPGLIVLSPFGDADGVRAILAAAPDLPSRVFLMTRDADLDAVRQHYAVDGELIEMRRMVLRSGDAQAAPPVDAVLRRLRGDDLVALRALNDSELERTAEMLERELYYGAFIDGELVAVAGTHAYAPSHSIGAVGGVFTRPDYRGRGLATATTGAVVQALLRHDVRDVALNVRADNTPAIRAYTRLGFVARGSFWEGDASITR